MTDRSDDDRPGARRELHTILRVSNVGGREVRFHKDGLVLIWDGKLMRYRPLESDAERSAVLAWVDDLRNALTTPCQQTLDHQSPKK